MGSMGWVNCMVTMRAASSPSLNLCHTDAKSAEDCRLIVDSVSGLNTCTEPSFALRSGPQLRTISVFSLCVPSAAAWCNKLCKNHPGAQMSGATIGLSPCAQAWENRCGLWCQLMHWCKTKLPGSKQLKTHLNEDTSLIALQHMQEIVAGSEFNKLNFTSNPAPACAALLATRGPVLHSEDKNTPIS